MSDEADREEQPPLEDLLQDQRVPPRGKIGYRNSTWERSFETVYLVQVTALNDTRTLEVVLRTVLVSVLQDCEYEGFDFDEMLEDAREAYSDLEGND